MKKFIKVFLQEVYVAKDKKKVWQFSSKERKPITLFGSEVTSLSFTKYVPGQQAQQTTEIYTCWLNDFTQDTIDDYFNANNGSVTFYLCIDEHGNEEVLFEEQGLEEIKAQMTSTPQPSAPQPSAS
jgi:hypothetical protein